jgi:cytoskeletal protein RodZ
MQRRVGVSIGDTLASARRDAGLSLTQISQRTRIRETIIRGIEKDDFSLCGGDFYARGHIRSVAKAVGLDPDPLIQEYDGLHGGIRQVSAAEVFEPATPIKIRERRSPNWSAAMALAVVVVVIYGVVRLFAGMSHPVNNAARREPVRRPAATAAPRHSPSPTAAPQPQHSVVVQLAANEDCWIGVYAADGTQEWQEIIPAGATRSWTFTRQVSMEIGNPGGIALTVNGRTLSSLGTNPVTLTLRPGHTTSG